MLAPNKIPTKEDIKWPMFASTKMDGIRCLVVDGELYTRQGKVVPNRRLHDLFEPLKRFSSEKQKVFDGEIWTPEVTFQAIMSLVTSQDKAIPDINLKYHCFDCISNDVWVNELEPVFRLRHSSLIMSGPTSERELIPIVSVVAQRELTSWEESEALLDSVLTNGGEGLMIRSAEGSYKHGRCTFREQNIFKLKQFEHIDAKVLEVLPLTRISVDAIREYDEFGHPKAVHKKGDRTTVEALGKLIVQLEDGTTMSVGSGFDFRGGEKDRSLLWLSRDQLIGKWIEFKYTSVGVKDKPRFPVFLRFRDDKE